MNPTVLRDRTTFRRTGSEFGWVLAGQAAAAVGLLVGVRLLTTHLSPGEYGILALGLTVSLFVNQLLTGPLSSAVLRTQAIATADGSLPSFFRALRRMVRLIAVGFMLISALLILLSIIFAVSGAMLAALALALALSAGLESVLDSVQNAARERKVVAFHQSLRVWSRFAVATLLVVLLSPAGEVALLGYFLASIAVFGSQMLFFRRWYKREVTGSAPSAEGIALYKKMMIDYARPFALWGPFTWLQLASDKWALAVANSTVVVGAYSALYQIGYLPLVLFSNALVQFVAPILFHKAGDATDQTAVREAHRLGLLSVVGTLVISVIGATLAWFTHDGLASLLLAADFRDESSLIPLMFLAGGAFAAGQVATQIPLVSMAPRSVVRPKLVAATIGTLLNLLGAIAFGIKGVGGALLLSNLIYLIWILRLSNRVLRHGSGQGGVQDGGWTPEDTAASSEATLS